MCSSQSKPPSIGAATQILLLERELYSAPANGEEDELQTERGSRASKLCEKLLAF